MAGENKAYTESMNRLIDEFARLPGIGRRTAERLAFHVLKTSKDEALGLARAIEHVKLHVKHCSRCFNLTEADPCQICADPKRDDRKILVVEQPKDLILLESTHAYDGVYHVLLGRIAPLEDVGPDDLTIRPLIERLKKLRTDMPAQPVEVILGLNPTLEGDGTALYLGEQLQPLEQVNVTRLARGLPAGSQLEFANKSVLSDAIISRQSVK